MITTRFQKKFREFASVLRNEYRNIFCDAGVLLIAVGAIFIYSTAYSLAYKNEVLRDVPVAVVDNSRTPSSRQLIRSFDATPNVNVVYKPASLDEAKKLFLERKVNGIIVIPGDYEKKLMRTEKVNLAIYADASYFLMYRQVFFDIMGSIGHSNSNVEWLRFVSKGVSSKQAEALSNPVSISVRNMYNPYLGYATFIMPAILMVIIQQTLLIGIGMVGGVCITDRTGKIGGFHFGLLYYALVPALLPLQTIRLPDERKRRHDRPVSAPIPAVVHIPRRGPLILVPPP